MLPVEANASGQGCETHGSEPGILCRCTQSAREDSAPHTAHLQHVQLRPQLLPGMLPIENSIIFTASYP